MNSYSPTDSSSELLMLNPALNLIMSATLLHILMLFLNVTFAESLFFISAHVLVSEVLTSGLESFLMRFVLHCEMRRGLLILLNAF